MPLYRSEQAEDRRFLQRDVAQPGTPATGFGEIQPEEIYLKQGRTTGVTVGISSLRNIDRAITEYFNSFDSSVSDYWAYSKRDASPTLSADKRQELLGNLARYSEHVLTNYILLYKVSSKELSSVFDEQTVPKIVSTLHYYSTRDKIDIRFLYEDSTPTHVTVKIVKPIHLCFDESTTPPESRCEIYSSCDGYGLIRQLWFPTGTLRQRYEPAGGYRTWRYNVAILGGLFLHIVLYCMEVSNIFLYWGLVRTTDAEKRYWPTELEVSCLVWVLRKLRHIIEASEKPTIVYTDHSATLNIARQTTLHTTSVEKSNLRLVTASQFIQRFDITLIHKRELYI